MRIWAIANQKGGVGKTTTAVNLAGLLSSRGERVLLVDFDPHGSLTTYFGFDPEKIPFSAYQLFQSVPQPLNKIVAKTSLSNIALLPASPALATLDRQLGVQSGKGLVLKTALETAPTHFDHVIIDCPPVLGVLMINALAACEHLVIPVQTEYLALSGLERMLSTLEKVGNSLKRSIPYTIVATLFDKRTRSGNDCLATLRARYPYAVSTHVVPVDTQFREASRVKLPLTVWQPDARGSHAYSALLDELVPARVVAESVPHSATAA